MSLLGSQENIFEAADKYVEINKLFCADSTINEVIRYKDLFRKMKGMPVRERITDKSKPGIYIWISITHNLLFLNTEYAEVRFKMAKVESDHNNWIARSYEHNHGCKKGFNLMYKNYGVDSGIVKASTTNTAFMCPWNWNKSGVYGTIYYYFENNEEVKEILNDIYNYINSCTK